MTFTSIRTTAYEPDSSHGKWVEPLYVATFAETLRDELMSLYGLGWKNYDRPRGLPIRQLNELLQAAAPGVIAVGRGAAADATAPWLYAREPVPEDLIAALFTRWVLSLRPEEEHAAARQRVLEHVAGMTPHWSLQEVDLTSWSISQGGTGMPDRRLYSLLPELLADSLATEKIWIGDDPLSFRTVGCDQGAELVSWPPRTHADEDGRTWFYSALVGITLQTVAFAPRPRVYVSYGIRRWVTEPPVLPKGKKIRVLLDAPRPWEHGEERMARLVGSAIQFDRELGAPAWRDRGLLELVPKLDLIRHYPSAEDVVVGAERWLRGVGDVAVGVVHNNATHGQHGVGTGLMPEERAVLDRQVAKIFEPHLRRVSDYVSPRRIKRKPRMMSRYPSAPEKREVVKLQQGDERRRALVAASGGHPIEINIFWQDSRTRDALIGDVGTLLTLPAPRQDEPEVWTWQHQDDGLRLTVRATRISEELCGPLNVRSDNKRSRADSLGEAIRERRAAVAEWLGTVRPGAVSNSGHDHDQDATALRGALVEFDGKQAFEHVRDSDPKFSLRLGCADADLVSQFIQTRRHANAKLSVRSGWAVQDLLRQLGVAIVPQHSLGTGLPADLQYLALWYVRRKSSGPTRRAARRLVMLRIRPKGREQRVDCWDELAKQWVPYPRFLIGLARGYGDRIADTESVEGAVEWTDEDRVREAQRRIRAVLYQMRDRPTMLLANVGNIRELWPGVSNNALVRDCVSFDGSGSSRLSMYGPDLRLVLTRDTNSRAEVPEWYAGAETDRIGFSVGLWSQGDAAEDDEDRVFLSTGDTANSAKHLTRSLYKLAPVQDKPYDPSMSASNPQALELTVAGCLSVAALAASGRVDVEPDDPAEWAGLAHQLRFRDCLDPLAKPLPLHLARLADEYVLPTDEADTNR